MAINSYCTLAEVKASLPNTTGDSFDDLLNRLIVAASRAIDRYTNFQPGAFFVNADVTRYYNGSGNDKLWIDPLAATPTSVSVAESGDITDYTAWAGTDYILWPLNALENGAPYYRLDIDVLNGTKSLWYSYPKSIKIVGKFGYKITVPDDVKNAAIIQVIRSFKRTQQAYRDTGAIVDLGEITYMRTLDPEVVAIIKHLKRMGV